MTTTSNTYSLRRNDGSSFDHQGQQVTQVDGLTAEAVGVCMWGKMLNKYKFQLTVAGIWRAFDCSGEYHKMVAYVQRQGEQDASSM